MLTRILWLGLVATMLLSAQNVVFSRLDGSITDSTGGVVPSAKVTVIDSRRGTSVTTATDDTGYYQVPRLTPGLYTVEVSKPGFQTQSRTGIELTVNQAAELNIQLSVEASKQAVEVSAEVSPLQTRSGELSALVSRTPIENLPLNGRNFQRLVFLAPGVAGFDVFGEAVLNPAFNGTRPAYNNFMVDGIGANDERLSVGFAGVINASSTDLGPDVPNVISTEALQEYRIISSNADASFGRGSGAQVNVVTKSGGNELHGSTYWYLRNDIFDARNFFNNGPFFDRDRRADVPPFQQNVFGASVGGPLVRNKHFFFANYEGFRQRRREQLLANIVLPNADLIRLIPGDLGRLFQSIYLDSGVLPREGNIPGAFSPLAAADRAAATAAGFPAALFNGNPADREAGTVLAAAAPKRDVDQNAFLIRTDHVFSERFSLAARYNQATSDLESGRPDFAINNLGARRVNYTALLQSVWTPLASHLFEFRGGVLRNEFRQFPVGAVRALQGLNIAEDTGLNISISGAPFNFSAVSAFVDHQTTPQASLQHMWNRGRWTLRSGFDWRGIQLNVANYSAGTPNYAFEGLIGANGLLGSAPGQSQAVARSAALTVFGANGGPQSPMRGYRSQIQEYFTQADWRASRDVTLNFGLRYSYFGVYREVNAAVSNLYAADGSGQVRDDVSPFEFGRRQYQLLPVGDGRRFYRPDWNNFQPRVGAAWNIGGLNRHVVRAGYGLYYDRLLQVQFTGVVANPPFSASSNSASVPFRLGPPPVNVLAGTPGITGIDPGISNPSVHRFNLAYEQTLGGGTTATVAYVGAFGRDITATAEMNGAGGVPNNLRPDSRYTTQNLVRNYGDSTYHSMQFSVQRRFRRGFDLNAFYTWSQYRDDWSRDAFGTAPGLLNTGARPETGFQGGGSQWVLRPRGAERGAAEYNIPHNFTLSHVWQLPFGRGTSALDRIIGGWAVSGLFIWRSGEPVNVTVGRDIDDDGNTARDRPALLSGSLRDLYANGRFGRTQYLVPVNDANSRLGVPADVTDPRAVIERNALRSASVQTYDLSVSKRIRLTERVAASLEGNAFNLLNRANFARPGSAALSSALFGLVTRTVTPSRQLQFGLKIIF